MIPRVVVTRPHLVTILPSATTIRNCANPMATLLGTTATAPQIRVLNATALQGASTMARPMISKALPIVKASAVTFRVRAQKRRLSPPPESFWTQLQILNSKTKAQVSIYCIVTEHKCQTCSSALKKGARNPLTNPAAKRTLSQFAR
jgi:hypothetical protein